MEPILLTGFPLGSSAGLVAAFEWLGQPYRLSCVDMLADMGSEAYARVNGRRETPVLITKESPPLTETMAIALWLEARDHERRISFAPGSPEADRLHQYMAFLNTGFTGAFSPLWVALEANDADESYRAALRAYGKSAVANRHAALEAMIGDHAYLLGDAPHLPTPFSSALPAGPATIRPSMLRATRERAPSGSVSKLIRPSASPWPSRTVSRLLDPARCAGRCPSR
jgi:glutathione S-transferase